jgi:selenocysteine-specific elongation factor
MVVDRSDELSDDGATVRLSGFTPGLDAVEKQAWEEARGTLAAGLAVPRASQLGLSDELLHALVRDEQLVRVASDLVFLPDQIDQVITRLVELDDEFTVAAFRDLLGITRRQAVPLLEWLDRHGFTRRRGDLRVLRGRQDS